MAIDSVQNVQVVAILGTLPCEAIALPGGYQPLTGAVRQGQGGVKWKRNDGMVRLQEPMDLAAMMCTGSYFLFSNLPAHFLSLDLCQQFHWHGSDPLQIGRLTEV